MKWVLGQSVGYYYYIPTESEGCLRCGPKKAKKVIGRENGRRVMGDELAG
jgi:hypothetical protein